jgi:hypothetical protein
MSGTNKGEAEMPVVSESALGKLAAVAAAGVQAAAAKQNNDLSTAAVASAKTVIKEEIKSEIANSPALQDVAVVDVKSAWASKINATNVAAILAMLGTILPIFGLEFSPETQRDILAGVIAIAGVGTVIFKTFFTKTITASSAGK